MLCNDTTRRYETRVRERAIMWKSVVPDEEDCEIVRC